MLGEMFERFVEKSPLSLMRRRLVERMLNPPRLEAWFGQVAESQYTRKLLFSTVVGMMLEVVCGTRKPMGAASQALVEAMPVTIQSVYNKLKGVEPATSAELVRYVGQEARAVIAAVGGQRQALLPGYPVKSQLRCAVVAGGDRPAVGLFRSARARADAVDAAR